MKIPRNISSELPRIGPSESPSKYHEEVLPRYIPRTFPTNWWSSEFLRKFISSEFRRIFSRDFRGKMNFRGVISEELFPRTCFVVVCILDMASDVYNAGSLESSKWTDSAKILSDLIPNCN
ncbi:hypothetical protein DY000_02049936 [Brassica cretica]|uniref:Uncharacterized protein n=1 Tax=Brassica cretica TaxID=69181 RepID=A0ABQ7F841_BRACR|nr:hypothetical protein DY000_02049936 [Brassica cretica]